MPKETFSVISLGCFRNRYDSELAAARFSHKGYVLKDADGDSDVLMINTCGFIDKAKDESIAVITRAVDLKKAGRIKKIFVFGCLVKRYQRYLEKAFPPVDEWWGIEQSSKFICRKKLLPRHIDFLKISEGCLNKCSYCAIPMIKGSLKSKTEDEIIKEARFLDQKGVRELNIIGQDIASWGADLSGKNDLVGLLRRILPATKNIAWIRLLYTHPRHFRDSLIDLIAGEQRLCKYIDLPIQHINDRILSLMRRGLTRKQIVSLVKKIRKKIPGCVIRTSVIAGFPTETEREFRELAAFLAEAKFERLGVFSYSREEDTPAYRLSPQVHHQTKARRYREIMALQSRIAQQVNCRFLGQTQDVLVEEKEGKMFVGRTQYDAYEVDGCVFLNAPDLKIGDFYKAKITDVYGYDLAGE